MKRLVVCSLWFVAVMILLVAVPITEAQIIPTGLREITPTGTVMPTGAKPVGGSGLLLQQGNYYVNTRDSKDKTGDVPAGTIVQLPPGQSPDPYQVPIPITIYNRAINDQAYNYDPATNTFLWRSEPREATYEGKQTELYREETYTVNDKGELASSKVEDFVTGQPPITITTQNTEYAILNGNPVPARQTRQAYDATGKIATINTDYLQDGTPQQVTMTYNGATYSLNADGTIDTRGTLELPPELQKQLRLRGINSGYIQQDFSFFAGFEFWGMFTQPEQWMKSFNEYGKPLAQLWALGSDKRAKWVQDRRNAVQQKYCIAQGIENCVTSAICDIVEPIESDNVAIGRSPTGEPTASAYIVAKKTPQITIRGLTNQQINDHFATNGKIIVNGQEKDAMTTTFGQLNVRLYDWQYKITNNAEQKDILTYNIRFEYRCPTGTCSRIAATKTLEYGETTPLENTTFTHYSATDYTQICIEFSPRLPGDGRTFTPKYISEFCVPIIETQEIPTNIPTGDETTPTTTPTTPTTPTTGGPLI